MHINSEANIPNKIQGLTESALSQADWCLIVLEHTVTLVGFTFFFFTGDATTGS